MSTTTQRLALLACLGAATLVAAACENAEARQRAEVQEMIILASQKLGPITTASREEQVKQELRGLIGKLDRTTGASPDQQAVAARLASSAHRKLAGIALDEAKRLEADHRSARVVLHGMIDSMIRLDTLAASLEALDTETEQARLARAREDAETQLRERSQEMAALDGPIAELTHRNREDRAVVERLRREASEFRREADELGRAAGFPAYQQRVQLDREADRIEYEIAQREAELAFSLMPQQTLARTRIEQLVARIAAADDALLSLSSLGEGVAEEARQTHQTIREYRETVDATLAELDESCLGPLPKLYEQAATDLAAGANKARRAGTMVKGESATTARIDAARAYLDLGAMHWSQGRGLADQIALLERVAAATVQQDAQTEELAAAHQATIENAKAAYESAQQLLGQVSAPAARRQLETLKSNVEHTIAALSG